MNEAQMIVEDFLTACEDLDFDGALAMIADDCVYRNMPFHVARGKTRISRDLKAMARAITSFDVEILNIAANGDTVLTERIDTIGGRFFKAPVELMGVFRVNEDGKICEWRDYFDWGSSGGRFLKSLIIR